MQNFIYTNIKPKISKKYLVDNIPNELEPTSLHTTKWLQALLHKTNIQHQQFVYTVR